MSMNGAQALIRTLADSGVEVCFSNPGTSEMHFVAALDSVPEMRAVLCSSSSAIRSISRSVANRVSSELSSSPAASRKLSRCFSMMFASVSSGANRQASVTLCFSSHV